MKLNYRDKIVLLVLFVVIVWVIGIWFFVVPAFQDLSSTNETLDTQNVELDKLQSELDEEADLENLIQKAYDSSKDIVANFYERQSPQEAVAVVNKTMTDTSLEISSISIDSYSISSVTPYSMSVENLSTEMDTAIAAYEEGKPVATEVTDATADTTDPSLNATANQIGSYSISVDFSGKYSDYKAFCSFLTTNTEKSMVITTANITPDKSSDGDAEGSASEINKIEDATKVNGQITLQLMMVRKPSDPSTK